MIKFDSKKFVALIAFHDNLRKIYFDKIEAIGINSRWDVYHVLAEEETVPTMEIEIMEQIYKDKILQNTELERLYNSAVENFRENVRKKITSSNK